MGHSCWLAGALVHTRTQTHTHTQAIEKKTLPSEEKYANGMLCNLNTAARALLPLALIAASVIVSVTASSLTAASVTS